DAAVMLADHITKRAGGEDVYFAGYDLARPLWALRSQMRRLYQIGCPPGHEPSRVIDLEPVSWFAEALGGRTDLGPNVKHRSRPRSSTPVASGASFGDEGGLRLHDRGQAPTGRPPA